MAAAMVSMEVPEPRVTDAGVKLPVTPDGKPLVLRLTVPVNPFTAVIVTVLGLVPPTVTLCVCCVVEIEKSAIAVTTRDTVALCVRVPLVPVMVKA